MEDFIALYFSQGTARRPAGSAVQHGNAYGSKGGTK